ncbi:interferon beta [Suncus etruscus]|uniref:interferon beta n=1 Tax=Suncus etruscus TaxID=109475 RepID=UPI00210F4E92|nr:interferon beta [Suncus etruscus]
MANRYIFQITLLLCFFTTAFSMSYQLLRSRQRSSNLACQRILSELNGNLTECLQQRINSTIPEEIKQPELLQKDDVLLVISEMLRQIFGIFSRNSSCTGWNKSIIEKLFLELQQQMDYVETSLEERKKENVTSYNRTILHLKKYYLKLLKYLKANGYSNCAWLIVKTEISRNFVFLNRLINYLPN